MNAPIPSLALAFVLALVATAAHSAPNKFLHPNAFDQVTLSPNGARVAMLDRSIAGKTLGVWGDASEFKPDAFHVSDGKGGHGEITSLLWAGSSHLALLSKGERDADWLHVLELGSGLPKRLEKEGRRTLLGSIAGTSRFLVVETPSDGSIGLCRIMEYDASNEGSEAIVRYECNAKSLQCVASAKGEIKLVRKTVEYGENDAWYRIDDASGTETKLENLRTWYKVYGMAGASESAIIAARIDSNVPGIYLYDAASDKVEKKLTDHPRYEIDRYGEMRFDRDDGSVVGLDLALSSYSTVWTNDALQDMQATVDQKLGGSVNRIIEWSENRKVALVERIFPMLPKQYVVANLATGDFKGVARCGGPVGPDEVGPTKLVEIPNRDGVPLDVVLTLPTKLDGGKLPLVVWIRSGVWSGIDRVEWSCEANFFASRGYAVARVNYRGGEGMLGDLAADTSAKDGILKMFSDIDDTVAALVKADLVDPNRIAIGGESAGGWAAAYAAKRNPSQYKAVLCLNGVYDLTALHDAKTGNDAGGGVSIGFARSESKMDIADIEELSVMPDLENFPGAVFICSGKWSPPEYRNQVSAFVKRLKKSGSSVKAFEGEWWGSALVGEERDEAFARAANVLKSAF